MSSGAAVIAAPAAVALSAFLVFRAPSPAGGLTAVAPDQMTLMVVEAHDEWTGDPHFDRTPPPIRGAGTSVASRNRNPLNIKYGALTRKYVDQGLASISRIIPRDGGRFLKFQSATGGFRAAAELLTSPLYTSQDLHSALKRWSNNGYGAEIVANTAIDPTSAVSTLHEDRLSELLLAMARAEGYRSTALASEISQALTDAPRPGLTAAK